MSRATHDLSFVYDGWEGYNRSLVLAIEPLTAEQLAYRTHPEMQSVGELAWHIGDGRVDWFNRMEAGGAGSNKTPSLPSRLSGMVGRGQGGGVSRIPPPNNEGEKEKRQRVSFHSERSANKAVILASSLLQESNAHPPETYTAADICAWLNRTWEMVQSQISQWTVDDLTVTYRQSYQGKVYAVSRQWVVWRIMAHDIHHGGQLSELLAAQGIFPMELTWLGGHLTEPEVVG